MMVAGICNLHIWFCRVTGFIVHSLNASIVLAQLSASASLYANLQSESSHVRYIYINFTVNAFLRRSTKCCLSPWLWVH